MKSYFEETEKQLRRALIFIVINIGLTAINIIIFMLRMAHKTI
nr:MAG TPA: hypothetical protein [Caudoviricetes sp.]